MAKHRCDKEDELLELYKQVSEMNVKVREMHKALMGNGRAGLIEKWNKLEGGLMLFKLLASIGGLSGIAAVVKIFLLP